MRLIGALLLTAALTAPLGCGDEVTRPVAPGQLIVYVYFVERGIEGTQIEIVETGDTETTDASGLARFTLAPGEYTVRAYDINRGGPCCEFVDVEARVSSDEEARVEILNCVSCD